jgi:threonine synthase
VATAHAAKFDTIVEPLLGIRIELPDDLAELLARPTHFETIPQELNALAARL